MAQSITLTTLSVQRDRYILNDEGTETWESRYSYRSLQYVQVEGFPSEPKLDAVEAKYVHSAIDESDESSFESSNELLNQIYENILWAMDIPKQYTQSPNGYPQSTRKHSSALSRIETLSLEQHTSIMGNTRILKVHYDGMSQFS